MVTNLKDYKYYAFISYSRKNSKVAAYFHRQLEHFRIPVKYVAEENRPPRQKFLRPIFRDRRDLEANENSFTEDIKKALENSRYLIVLCSPESAQSNWVEKEVKHFLKTHNQDYRLIVPVVLSGCPGCASGTECLPLSLRLEEITSRNLPSMIPDEGEDEKNGWLTGVVQSMSYMLKVNRERIRATVDAERIRQNRIYALIFIGATFICAGFAIWATYSRYQAQEQAEIARESLSFLTNMFQSVDPTITGDKNITVLEAIKSKIPEIKNIEKSQVKANIARDFGSILNNLGEYDQAMELMRIWYESNIQSRLDELILYHNNMGTLLFRQEKYEEALKHLHKAYEIYPIDDDIMYRKCDLDTVMNNIGAAYIALGDCNQAIEIFKLVLQYREIKSGLDDPDVATTYNNIGSAYSDLGKYEEALLNYKKSLSIKLKALGEFHPGVATIYNNIGSAYSDLGKYEEALLNYKKSLLINLKALGDFHPDVARDYHNIGGAYSDLGKCKEALLNYKKSLSIYIKALGESHPSVALTYSSIGDIYALQGRYADALNLFQKSYDVFSVHFGEEHPDAKRVLNRINRMTGVSNLVLSVRSVLNGETANKLGVKSGDILLSTTGWHASDFVRTAITNVNAAWQCAQEALNATTNSTRILRVLRKNTKEKFERKEFLFEPGIFGISYGLTNVKSRIIMDIVRKDIENEKVR